MEQKKESEEQKKVDDLADGINKISTDDKAKTETKTETKPNTGDSQSVKTDSLLGQNNLLSQDLSWDDLGIRKEIKESLLEMDFLKPSKVQSTTFPLIMKEPRKHLIAQAKNGAGKTAAFGLGIISSIDESIKSCQVIVFAHFRELVTQITDVLKKIAAKTNITINSWLNDDKIFNEAQVLVMTPGNFENNILKRKRINLDTLKMLVLDEADFMLSSEGTNVNRKIFQKTFEKLCVNNKKIQVLFFSATFTEDNFKFIEKYFKSEDINKIELNVDELSLDNVKQMYYYCNSIKEKIDFIEDYIKSNMMNERVIIFVDSRDNAVRLQQNLMSKGYKVYIIMGGDMSKENRDETIKRFNDGQIQILITTNLLARGYDEKLVKLVINFELPKKREGHNAVDDPETYLHRIGRTGRFGAKGIGLNLISGKDEMDRMKRYEEYYKKKVEKIESVEKLLEDFKKIVFA